MGKTLVHRAKLVPAVSREGEPGIVLAAALPRSAVVQGTFQVTTTQDERWCKSLLCCGCLVRGDLLQFLVIIHSSVLRLLATFTNCRFSRLLHSPRPMQTVPDFVTISALCLFVCLFVRLFQTFACAIISCDLSPSLHTFLSITT